MKKRLLALTLGLTSAAAICIGVLAADKIKEVKAQLRPDFTIEVDGEQRVFKNADGDVVYPLLYEGTTYLPVRAIGELMGKTVYWYEDDKRIELKEEKTTVTDADVIITDSNTEKDKAKPDKTDKSEKPEKPDKTQFITPAKAKGFAFEKAGVKQKDVRKLECELDEDDGVYYYDIDFEAGEYEYEIEVAAVDGEILSFDKDLIDDDDD